VSQRQLRSVRYLHLRRSFACHLHDYARRKIPPASPQFKKYSTAHVCSLKNRIFQPPTLQPTHTLRRFKQNNTCPLCLAATAGTELVGAIRDLQSLFTSPPTGFTAFTAYQIPHELSRVRVSPIAQYPRQNPSRLEVLGRFKS